MRRSHASSTGAAFAAAPPALTAGRRLSVLTAFAALTLALAATLAGGGAPAMPPAVTDGGTLGTTSAALPLAPNVGQSAPAVRFEAHTRGGALLLEDRQIVVVRGGEAIPTRFVGSARRPALVPAGRLPGVVNFLHGADRSAWRLGVPSYAAVRYRGLWPGVDVRVSAPSDGGAAQALLRLAPGADARAVRWSAGPGAPTALAAWQVAGGRKVAVPVRA